MKIRVALIDDHPIFVAGLKQLLESDGRYGGEGSGPKQRRGG